MSDDEYLYVLARNLAKYQKVHELESLASKMNISLRGRKEEKALLLASALLGLERFEERETTIPDYIFSITTGEPGSNSEFPPAKYPSVNIKHPEKITDLTLSQILQSISSSGPGVDPSQWSFFGNNDSFTYYSGDFFLSFTFPRDTPAIEIKYPVSGGDTFLKLEGSTPYVSVKGVPPKIYNTSINSYSGFPSQDFKTWYFDTLVSCPKETQTFPGSTCPAGFTKTNIGTAFSECLKNCS